MNKAISILFLLLFVFYLVGYKMLFMSLQYKAETSLNALLEVDKYDKDQAITLTIPLSLPYQIYEEGFHPLKGDFAHEGEFYSLIKQKLENDTLYVVCLKNDVKSGLFESMNSFERIMNNWPDASKKSANLMSFVKDYMPNAKNATFQKVEWSYQLNYMDDFLKTLKGHFLLMTPPPKLNLNF